MNYNSRLNIDADQQSSNFYLKAETIILLTVNSLFDIINWPIHHLKLNNAFNQIHAKETLIF